MILASNVFNNPFMIVLIIVLGFALIGGIAFLIHYLLKRQKPKEAKPDEKQAAAESLSMYLEDVDDPEIKKQFEEYHEKEEDDK